MRPRKSKGYYFLLLMILFFVIYAVNYALTYMPGITQNEFEKALVAKDIKEIVIEQETVPTGKVLIYFHNGTKAAFYTSDVSKVEELLERHEFTDYALTAVKKDGYFKTTILPCFIIIFGVIAIILVVNNAAAKSSNAQANSMMNFGKSRARRNTNKSINFSKVAGLREEKEELFEIVDFLKGPSKYIEMGARIPKGVLFTGSPGTGKTLLAKAVAGEAGVPFFSISGSDFVEMFVGVGASRVRDLFLDAKKNAPCIIFIDEIDAVARRRGTGMGGGHDEREQTLNQLLVEMDGFSQNEGIIIIAATNRVDILDPAILRPGRFDRKIEIGKPDSKGREEILAIHAENKRLGDDVDLKRVAQTTAGYTGADLENLLNEAAISAAKESKGFISQKEIETAFTKVSIGTEKRSRVISDEDKKITAYHETGHAILFQVLPGVGPVHTISIIPTGRAAGYTMPMPKSDEMFMTKERLLHHIMVSLGGRIAEEIVFNQMTTGASQDIKDATATARAMVTQYGMSDELGMIHYDSDEEVFIGRDLAHKNNISDETARLIDAEVRTIISDCYNKAKAIIVEHIDVLHKCSAVLIEKEKITTEEFEQFFKGDI